METFRAIIYAIVGTILGFLVIPALISITGADAAPWHGICAVVTMIAGAIAGIRFARRRPKY